MLPTSFHALIRFLLEPPQVQPLAPPCQASCLGESPLDTLPCVLSAQVVSALSSPKEGPRNLRTRSEVSCHSGPPSTQKMVLSAELDPDFDPNTILQTQDCLNQDYEGLGALAKVTNTSCSRNVHGTPTLHWTLNWESRDRAVDWTCSLPPRSLHRQRRGETGH